jgi:serine/threonine-protein kinase
MTDSTTNSPSSLAAGQRIGEYVLTEVAGRGAYGEVWAAHHHVWKDNRVAVKVPTDPAYLRSLRDEGQAVHHLDHPNIAKALGFDPFAPMPYLVVEYVGGGNLRQFMGQFDGNKIDPDDAAHILRQVLLGLQHAHDRGVVHRDVKPENVLLTADAKPGELGEGGMVKLTDFGLGAASNPKALAESIAYSMDAADDAAKQIAGTLDYMAPEVRAGQGADATSDLYSCGVMLFEMLTGEKPAGGEVPSDLRPGLDKKFDVVFRGSYARREKRYKTAADMAAALGAQLAPPPLPRRDAPPMPPKRQVVGNVAPPKDCKRCGGSVAGDDQFCMHCGTQLAETVRRCNNCGGHPAPGDRFCIFCGGTLDVPAEGGR